MRGSARNIFQECANVSTTYKTLRFSEIRKNQILQKNLKFSYFPIIPNITKWTTIYIIFYRI